MTHALHDLDDNAARDAIADAIRQAGGYRGGAELLGVDPRELAHLVARRGLDIVGALSADVPPPRGYAVARVSGKRTYYLSPEGWERDFASAEVISDRDEALRRAERYGAQVVEVPAR